MPAYGEGQHWRDSATLALDAMHERATKAEAEIERLKLLLEGQMDDFNQASASLDACIGEVAWRKQAMIDARDCLACGDAAGAYVALDRHHHTAATSEKEN